MPSMITKCLATGQLVGEIGEGEGEGEGASEEERERVVTTVA